MKDWKKTLIRADATIMEAMKVIDVSSLQIALVVDEKNRLLGTVTDGDIRRCILRNVSLEEPVQRIMNPDPVVASDASSRSEVLALMREKMLRQIPIVDVHGIIVSLQSIETVIHPVSRDNWVVIMAGGEGVRLRPMTNDCPKPMLKVGGKPIIETILDNFIEFGFQRFFFAVNYKAGVIEEYFGNGADRGVRIEYLREEEKLGTAGALSLIPEKPDAPIIVMNGDVLSRINFEQLLNFHHEHHAAATMCVREYDLQVPFGVAEVSSNRLIGLEEKPVHRFFINAGIYVLNPEVLERVRPNRYCDMPTIFKDLIAEKAETAVFPVREYWLDLGQMEDFARAQVEFTKVFK
jgi:dTDP-glucose pyrophosphorylase